MTEKLYTIGHNRRDNALIVFSADSEDTGRELSRAISANCTTGYVRATSHGATLPAHARDAVEAHLNRLGWSARTQGESK